jgi:hypothetical protein
MAEEEDEEEEMNIEEERVLTYDSTRSIDANS